MRKVSSPTMSSPKSSASPRGPAVNRPASPQSPGSRSYGAESFSADFVKRQSLTINTTLKDPETMCVNTIPGMDLRCVLQANGSVWAAEREGSITIRRTDGEIQHVIERRKGAYVFCMAEVGNTVWAGCSDGFIRVINQQTFKMERQFARHGGGGGAVNAIVFHAPSGSVFSGSNDFEIIAWDATTCEFIRQFSGHGNAVRALLADTHTLYSGSDDGTVIVWDLVSGQKVQQWTGHTKGVHSLCLSETHLWTGAADATVRIWNPATGECIGVAEVHTGAVNVLHLVGDKIWSGAGDTICVWDSVQLKLLGTYVVHDGYVGNILTISKTTQYKIWSSASDKQVKVWSTESTPDETVILKRKLDRLSAADYDNARLQEGVAVRDKQIEDLTRKLREALDEVSRLTPLRDENLRLREEVIAREDTIARLQSQLREADTRTADLCSQIASLERLAGDLRHQNERLSDDLAATKSNLLAIDEKLRDTVGQYENKIHELNCQLAALETHKSTLQTQLQAKDQENDQLRDELRRASGEIQSLSGKLREMDVIFKSRLTLITELFKLFKRLETVEKRVRASAVGIEIAREPLTELATVINQFKNTIANHYTDDELNHLGSSRHFFPVLGSPAATSPSNGSRSPTSAPGRR